MGPDSMGLRGRFRRGLRWIAEGFGVDCPLSWPRLGAVPTRLLGEEFFGGAFFFVLFVVGQQVCSIVSAPKKSRATPKKK